MDAKTFDKAKLPSRHVTEGPTRAPHHAIESERFIVIMLTHGRRMAACDE